MVNRMYKSLLRYKWYLTGAVLIFLFTYIVGVQNVELPGVYFDAVYPDYLAAIGAFPEVDNFTQITQHAGLPLLGNFYHGTLTAAVQFVVLKCVGQASVYTLRLTNMFYIAIIGTVLFMYAFKISKKWFPSLVGALLCVTSQNALAFSRTQYYIMLPGVLFFFLSVFILFENLLIKKNSTEKLFIIAGIFQGLAFYDYFTFLLMAPASLAVILLHEIPSKRKTSIFTYLWAIAIGSMFYFFGYYDSLLVNIFGFSTIAKILLYAGCMLMLVVFFLPLSVILCPKYKKYRKILFKLYMIMGVVAVIIGIVALVGAAYFIPDKMTSVLNLLSLSQNRNSGQRFLLFWNLLYQLLSNDCSQQVMFGEQIEDIGFFFVSLCLIITTLSIFLHSLRKQGEKEGSSIKILFDMYLYIGGFYICSLPIVTGMQPQHFVIIHFIMFFIIIIGGCYICSFLSKRVALLAVTIFLALGAGINSVNNKLLLEILEKTGGRGKFSSAYNEFACKAYADEKKEKKIYVFPEWGFNANFIYLTSNSCKTIRDADIDITEIQQQIDDGYYIVITAVDENLIKIILEQLHYEEYETEIWKSMEGEKAFICVNITG